MDFAQSHQISDEKRAEHYDSNEPRLSGALKQTSSEETEGNDPQDGPETVIWAAAGVRRREGDQVHEKQDSVEGESEGSDPHAPGQESPLNSPHMILEVRGIGPAA